MDSSDIQQLIPALTTVFFFLTLGFIAQRMYSIAEQTLKELSSLVVEMLLPLYLFYTAAITSAEFPGQALLPALMGALITFLNYFVAVLALKPSGVTPDQKSAFLFANMFSNTAFLGIPICSAIFGPQGAVYAVLYDFGTGLIILTLGIWELTGGDFGHWRPLVLNPLIWGVVAGLLWSSLDLTFPRWVAAPLETLGGGTLPLAILVCGFQLGNIRLSRLTWWRQLAGLTVIRLFISPLVAWIILTSVGASDFVTRVSVVAAAMPVGLSTAIVTKKYGADAGLAASATLWSTLFSILTLSLIIFVLNMT